jgi:DNA-binding LacI/PurR family transcriptional regulator
VFIDEREMVRLGVDALAKQGCRDIRLWVAGDDNPPTENTPGYADIEQVRCGFEQALKDNGLECDLAAIYSNRSKSPHPLSREQQGVAAATELLKNSNGKLPDGLMITDDMMALGVLRTLYEHGVRPGVDIQIASQENKGVLILSIFAGYITRVQVDTEFVARKMFEILDQELAGAQSEQWIHLTRPFTVLLPYAVG